MSVLDYPFIGYKEIMEIIGPTCSKQIAYKIINDVMTAVDDEGKPLVDRERMLPTNRKLIPTEVLCEKYGIQRKRG